MMIDRLRDAIKEQPDIYDVAVIPDASWLLKLMDDYVLLYQDLTRVLESINPKSTQSVIIVGILTEAKDRAEKILMQP